jgi:thiol-disulfide isomerase/thioredoxin
MKRKLMTYFFVLGILAESSAQMISGNLAHLSSQSIKLGGFNGLASYAIDKTDIDAEGNFKLHYTKSDYGIGYLISADNKAFFVILSEENTEIHGDNLSLPEAIEIYKGHQNQWFGQYALEQQKRAQALSAWHYLEKIYDSDTLFVGQKTTKQNIQKELNRIKEEDSLFLTSLPADSYVRWFLPIRKLVSSVSVVAQFHPEDISATIVAFRELDYTDHRLYKSGLFKEAIENHFWLLENSGKVLDSVFIEMQFSIDAMMLHLIKDEKKLNEITEFLFDLLERYSLFQAAEYLALKVLNEVSCTIDSDLVKQLETYRVMKKGNIAPDIVFDGAFSNPMGLIHGSPKRLSEINSTYVLVIFGASWCPKCLEEMPEIVRLYQKWKAHDVEIVFISLDEDAQTFEEFVKEYPFMAFCDYRKWESPMVKDFYVFGTPTMFLLDFKKEILLRPASVKQIDGWIDWNLSR